jgi:hypothetical protein
MGAPICKTCGVSEWGHTCSGARVSILIAGHQPTRGAMVVAMRKATELVKLLEDNKVTCATCGRRFEPTRSTARYCSASCRVKASRSA